MPHPPTDYYEKNMATLKKMQPHLWAGGQPHFICPPEGELFFGADNKPNLKVRNDDGEYIDLHLLDNPEAEVNDFLNCVPEDSTAVITLLGLGLGYSALGLLRHRPKVQKLIIFELNPGIFHQAMRAMDLTDLLTDPRVILSIDPEPKVEQVISQASRALQLEIAQILKHCRSISIASEKYEKLDKELFAHINKFNVAGATNSVFGRDFLFNRLRHLTSIIHNYLLGDLHNIFEKIPAIIVAGGPSLDQNIHLLEGAKDKAVIIAVDTVLPALLRHNVKPHFVSSIDPQPLTFEKFADVVTEAKGISLICMPWVTPLVPKAFPAEKIFWAFTAKPIDHWLNNILGGKILTGGAGTVAHLNLLAAIIMGCDPIIFVGQDLGYTNISSSHAQHTFLTDQSESKKAFSASPDARIVEGINGSKIHTNRAFYDDKRYFERIINDTPRHYINATAAGANIEGTDVLPLAETIKLFCNIPVDIRQGIETHLGSGTKINGTKVLTALNETLKEIRHLKELIGKADLLTQKLQQSVIKISKKNRLKINEFSDLPQSLQKKTHTLDHHHRQLDNAQHVWKLLEEITISGLRESERMHREITSISQDRGTFMVWFLKSLKRHLYINSVRKDVLNDFEMAITYVIEHCQKENILLKQISGDTPLPGILKELAELYLDAEDYVQAAQVLEKALVAAPHDADIHYYIGTVALNQSNIKKAQKHFQKTAQLDPNSIGRIQKLYEKFGDRYLNYAERYRPIDRTTFLKLLRKGLHFCPTHQKILTELQEIAAQDITAILSAVNSGKIDTVKELVLAWWVDEKESDITKQLKPHQIAEFQRLHGNMLVREGSFKEAIASFQKALLHEPNNKEYHIMLADAAFALGQFDTGINHVKEAARIDHSYGAFFENIGDNMAADGNDQEALIAYEQCFLALPNHLEILKKISTCHLKLNQPEAAKEALQQLKSLLLYRGCKKDSDYQENHSQLE